MSSPIKPKILIISDYYLPNYKSGGGIRTIVNIVEHFHDRYEFCVITRDHVYANQSETLTDIRADDWNSIENARVYYLSRANVKISKLRELILSVKPDALFFNSYFSPLTIFALQLRKLRLIPKINVLVAPCGELSEHALNIKRAKKQVFLTYAKVFGLFKNLNWKASTDAERLEIERFKGRGGKIFVAPELSPKSELDKFELEAKPVKKQGEAKMIFLSRFVRKKNFKWLLENLKGIEGKLSIDIFGPIEDADYWEECLQIAAALPDNISVESKGSVPFEAVPETLARYQFFILPTLNENFGYVFLEALSAGCPLIISDQTPWRGLETKAVGWDISLDEPAQWVKIINQTIEMDAETFQRLSNNAVNLAQKWLADSAIIEQNRRALEETVKI